MLQQGTGEQSKSEGGLFAVPPNPSLKVETMSSFLSFLWAANGFAYQVPMYELVALQKGHAFANIIAHFQELGGFKTSAMTLQVIKQAAIGYIFSHYVYRVSLWAHSVEFHQLGMVEFPGNNRFSKFSIEFPHSIFQMPWKRIMRRFLFVLLSPLLLEQRRGKCFGYILGALAFGGKECFFMLDINNPSRNLAVVGAVFDFPARNQGSKGLVPWKSHWVSWHLENFQD